LPLLYGNGKYDVTPPDFIERIKAQCRDTTKPANAACNEMYLGLQGQAINWWNSLRILGKDMAMWSTVKEEFFKGYDLPYYR